MSTHQIVVHLSTDVDGWKIAREDAAQLTAIASSIVSSIQQPDPSEAGLFNAPQRPRIRNYHTLGGTYT